MGNTTNKSSPASNTMPSESPNQQGRGSASGWQDFGSVDSGDSHYSDTAVAGRDEFGYGNLGEEAPAEQGSFR